MHKLDFLGVTQTEYDILRLFRDAIANTKRLNTPSWYTVNVDTENHKTVYNLCDGYDVDALLYATGSYMDSRHSFDEGCSAERALREIAESKGATTLHVTRMQNPDLHDRCETLSLARNVAVKPLNLTEILTEDPAHIDTKPYYIHGGIGGIIRVGDDRHYHSEYLTHHTLYGAITSNSGNELELGNLRDKCYACGKGIKFGIKEQYPLLTKEQQESTVGRAWGLLEAFYKDIRSRRGDFSEIPSVDEVLMLVLGYGVFPEPEQVKGKKNKRKLTATPKQHREVETALQASEVVDEDTRSPKDGKSKRKRRHATETVIWIIITLVWCTPLNHLVPGIESLPDGFKLVGALALLIWGYRVLKL